MSDYRDIWQESYEDARQSGLTPREAKDHADRESADWTERQQAKAEAMEDR